MKSTGEVLGIGKTLAEALYKGLTAAGYRLDAWQNRSGGVLLSVDEHDYQDVLSLAKKFYELGMALIEGTADAVRQLGIDVSTAVLLATRSFRF